MEFNDIKLKKGMTKDEVNELTSKWILFNEDTYMGSKHIAEWVCPICGGKINSRLDKLKMKKELRCGECTYKERKLETKEKYEDYINNIEGYEFIKVFYKDDLLPDNTICSRTSVLIKHIHCNKEYIIRFSDFKDGDRCIQCCREYEKSIEFLNPIIAKQIIYDEHNIYIKPKYISACSNRKFYIKCCNCGKISDSPKSINKIHKKGFSCKYCSDGVSTPEKFMANVLNQLGVKFITQLNSLKFSWIENNKRYDFYIPSSNIIIETHGLQHYEDGFLKYDEQNKIDMYKKDLALSNGIDSYIEVDCSKSEFIFLKNNVYNSLNKYFDLKDIDWIKAWNDSQKSLIVEVWKLWNSKKFNSTLDLATYMNLSRSTITRYLNKGNKVGMCDYNNKDIKCK